MRTKTQPIGKSHAQKKAGIYDRWLHTLGGGEQVAFAYAETLRSLGYKTELLTHRLVDLKAAEKLMDVDLRGIKVRYLPNKPDYQLSQYTEEYDVFVSNSFLDYVPNRSPFGVLSVFFPSRIKVSIYEYLKRAHILPSLRRFFVYPSFFEGFRFDEFKNGKLHKWLGKKSTVYFNHHIERVQLQLWIEYLSFSCIDRIQFKLGDTLIEPASRSINHVTNIITFTFLFPDSADEQGLSILLPDSEYSESIALISLRIQHFRYFLYNIFKSLFPSWEMRLHGGPSATKFSDIDSYDKIVAISKFSQTWIQKYWGMRSRLLHPPVNIQAFTPAKQKRNVIAHVGRFFVGGHSKKQLDLVRVFKRMVSEGLTGWELHLVGGVAEGAVHAAYVQTIREEAEGFPIVLHTNASFDELREVLRFAKIYWHATGLDEDNNRYPIRLEHFGITTVEAMAAGCVPVVIQCGGQPEIIQGTSAGFLWKTREELVEKTMKLVKDPALLNQMREAALERSKDFSRERFSKELRSILSHA